MPQLNPAPWLLTLLIMWSTAFALLKMITPLQNPLVPTKHAPLYPATAWMWLWL